MRTTLNLEDDAIATARAYAHARAIKLGQAVSELIRRGSSPNASMKQVDGVWMFDLPHDAPKITALQIKLLLDKSP